MGTYSGLFANFNLAVVVQGMQFSEEKRKGFIEGAALKREVSFLVDLFCVNSC